MLDDARALLVDSTATSSLHVMLARLLHRVATMEQDADKRMKMAQRRYNSDQDKKIRKAPQLLPARQSVYVARTQVKRLLQSDWRLIRRVK